MSHLLIAVPETYDKTSNMGSLEAPMRACSKDSIVAKCHGHLAGAGFRTRFCGRLPALHVQAEIFGCRFNRYAPTRCSSLHAAMA